MTDDRQFVERFAEVTGGRRPARREMPWWEAYVPAWAGPVLAAELRDTYDIRIEVRGS
ncbi:hypothetical protein ACGGAQ_05070 [Micromonospora sp. NPDC047557]|uniref:hypothetical protein n=1 Tax=Micromonospora sp. NPDC047557 TaxID=3364250 RepID=UPI00371563AF